MIASYKKYAKKNPMKYSQKKKFYTLENKIKLKFSPEK